MVSSGPGIQKQPLHVAISQKLKEQIDLGQYSVGEQLPSEFDLGELFGVSRTTVRRAIANLIKQGIVVTQQGKGIFVSGRQKIRFSLSNPLMHFDQALQQQGYASRVKSLSFQQINASTEIILKLQLSDRTSQVYRQEKIIYADDTPIALEIDCFPAAIASPLAEALQQGFTYSTLSDNNIALKSAKVSLESFPATYELSNHLAAPLGLPILVFSYIVYGDNQQPVVCGKTLSRSDWTQYVSQIETSEAMTKKGLPIASV